MAPLDPWLAADKLQHVAFCAAVAAAAYVAARGSRSHVAVRWRLAIGAATSLTAGLLKELGDAVGLWPGRPSARDGAADVVGAAVALAALAYVDATAPAWLDAVVGRAAVASQPTGH